MGKLSPEDKRMVLDFMDELFQLDQIGWDQSDLLRECGRMLGDDDQPQYMQKNISVKDYNKALKIAQQNSIPVAIFKQRLKRGHTLEQAATKKYKPWKRG